MLIQMRVHSKSCERTWNKLSGYNNMPSSTLPLDCYGLLELRCSWITMQFLQSHGITLITALKTQHQSFAVPSLKITHRRVNSFVRINLLNHLKVFHRRYLSFQDDFERSSSFYFYNFKNQHSRYFVYNFKILSNLLSLKKHELIPFTLYLRS